MPGATKRFKAPHKKVEKAVPPSAWCVAWSTCAPLPASPPAPLPLPLQMCRGMAPTPRAWSERPATTGWEWRASTGGCPCTSARQHTLGEAEQHTQRVCPVHPLPFPGSACAWHCLERAAVVTQVAGCRTLRQRLCSLLVTKPGWASASPRVPAVHLPRRSSRCCPSCNVLFSCRGFASSSLLDCYALCLRVSEWIRGQLGCRAAGPSAPHSQQGRGAAGVAT